MSVACAKLVCSGRASSILRLELVHNTRTENPLLRKLIRQQTALIIYGVVWLCDPENKVNPPRMAARSSGHRKSTLQQNKTTKTKRNVTYTCRDRAPTFRGASSPRQARWACKPAAPADRRCSDWWGKCWSSCACLWSWEWRWVPGLWQRGRGEMLAKVSDVQWGEVFTHRLYAIQLATVS